MRNEMKNAWKIERTVKEEMFDIIADYAFLVARMLEDGTYNTNTIDEIGDRAWKVYHKIFKQIGKKLDIAPEYIHDNFKEQVEHVANRIVEIG